MGVSGYSSLSNVSEMMIGGGQDEVSLEELDPNVAAALREAEQSELEDVEVEEE